MSKERDLTKYINIETVLEQLNERYSIKDLLQWRVRQLLSSHAERNPANQRENIYPPETVEWLADFRRSRKPIPEP